MKRFAASLLAVGLATVVGAASAQNAGYASKDRNLATDGPYYDYARVVRVDPVISHSYGPSRTSGRRCYSESGQYTSRDDDRYDDRYGDRYGNRDDDRYADANDGYYDRDGRWHSNTQNSHGTETGRNVATVLGGVVGAVIGSKVGGGNARYATSAIGSMVGGMAGRGIYENSQRQRQQRANVTVCDPSDDGRYDVAANEVTSYDVTYDYNGHRYVTRTDYHPGDRIRVRVDVRPE